MDHDGRVNLEWLSVNDSENETGGTAIKRATWALPLSELIGTLLLVAVGCSFVVIDFAPKSPVVHGIPDVGVRRAITGFLFGLTGGAIALSKVGKISGAHINPVVTLAFWLHHKISGWMALRYLVGQFLGAIIGAGLLVLWGGWAKITHYAATTPGPEGAWVAVVGETITTFCLVVALFSFLGSKKLRRYTPGIFPVLYAVMVWLEAPWSGTSTNPARTLGPAVVSHVWSGWWVYFVGPLLGMVLGILVMGPVLRFFAWEIASAKLYYFHHDPYQVFHGHLHRSQDRQSTG